MLSSYIGHVIYFPIWHEIFIMIRISFTMIHDELRFRHVRVKNVENSGLPMTVNQTWLVKVWTWAMDWEQLVSPIEENQTRLVKVWTGMINQAQLSWE